jgi:hypothetical protein
VQYCTIFLWYCTCFSTVRYNTVHYGIGTEYCRRILLASYTSDSEIVSIALIWGKVLPWEKKILKRKWLLLIVEVAWIVLRN